MTARFEAPEKLHITLAFLGWVDTPQLDQIQEAITDIAAAHGPFVLRLDRISAFPSERRPRIIFAGARAADKTYGALAAHVRTTYQAMDFDFKTDAVAHVTLCRLKHFEGTLPLIDFNPIDIPVREIALFQSLPSAHTTRYEILHRAALRTEYHPSTGSG